MQETSFLDENRPRDTGQYRHAPLRGRPRLEMPGGARMAFWIAPNIEHYEWMPPVNPNRHPNPRVMPDVMNYSMRDYGNRIGFRRIAEEMARRDIRGSVSLSVTVVDHFPEIIARCNDLGWELFSHGIYNTRYFYGMTLEEQRRVVIDSRETLARVGQSLDGWLTPAITPSLETQEILAQEGVRYTLDYFHDDQPMPLSLKTGRLISVPYSIEMNDTPMAAWHLMSGEEILASLKAQFDRMYAEGAQNPRVMCFAIHPFVLGQPHRIDLFAEFLDYVKAHADVWYPTGREIAEWYYETQYDRVSAWLGTLEGEA
ncbi:polysaccharide deacetylase family protein [Mangrovicoccus algicola]|uniref:polysaccharide deacetylase n=1 Tax=Mangrovicoccus algicola TaxID=2771008 RepID=UPI001D00DA70|nr:polysaccharide deacetylase [Mangrovicoccus algicola]